MQALESVPVSIPFLAGQRVAARAVQSPAHVPSLERLFHCPRPADPARVPNAVTCDPEVETDAWTTPSSATLPLKPANPGRVMSPAAIWMEKL